MFKEKGSVTPKDKHKHSQVKFHLPSLSQCPNKLSFDFSEKQKKCEATNNYYFLLLAGFETDQLPFPNNDNRKEVTTRLLS